MNICIYHIILEYIDRIHYEKYTKNSKILYKEGHADMSSLVANNGINKGRKIRHYSFLNQMELGIDRLGKCMNQKPNFIYCFW